MTKETAQLLKKATIASVSVAILLATIKFCIWFYSGSISVLASTIDSLFDVATSLINFCVVKIALKPADRDHHFGHAKAEHLATLAQASFIAGSALYLIFYAVSSLRENVQIEHSKMAIVAMIISLVVSVLLVSYQKFVYKKTGSQVIKVDSLHYKMDIFIHFGVLISLLLSQAGWAKADPVISIIIALIMLFNIKKIFLTSVDYLMDKAFPEDLHLEIKNMIVNTNGIQGVHDLRTRKCSIKPLIQFHLDVDKNLSLRDAHNLGLKIKQKLLKKISNADIIFHIDPV